MIYAFTNRRRVRGSYVGDVAQGMAYHAGSEWRPVSQSIFHRELLGHLRAEIAKGRTPVIVCLVHGFNVSWPEALSAFSSFSEALAPMEAEHKLRPVVVGYSWPSDGCVTKYLDDRQAARLSAEALGGSLHRALDLLEKEKCCAKLCVVAHSMGNFVLSQAARLVWRVRGEPANLRLVSEVLMLAPDLDGEAFEPEGEARPLATLSRRITVYYSRHDGALLARAAKVAGLAGARLGRQGFNPALAPGNVCAVDCSPLVTPDCEGGSHSGYFHVPDVLRDIRATLAGVDRHVVAGRSEGETPGIFALGRGQAA